VKPATIPVGLPCTYISQLSQHALFQVFSLADIVHFGLLSPPCTFPGIQITLHSAYRFLHFHQLPATSPLGYISRAHLCGRHPVTSSRHF